MKKSLIAGIIINAAFMMGCSNHDAEKQAAQLLTEKDSLITLVNSKDSATSVVMNSLNDIESNLEEVKKHQNMITANTSTMERTGNIKDRISDDIIMINNLMDENKKKIAYLTSQMNETSYKLGNFEKLVSTMKDQIMAKDAELKELNDKLLAMNTDIVELKSSNAELTSVSERQMETIGNQTSKMNTAYYVVGTYKSLKTEKVIDKDGGVLGLGTTQRIKADFNPASFKKIDITETSIIPIEAKKIEILSTHPSGSYELEKDANKMITKLVIKDPERFWEASKYLVVMKD
jgi:hypothetical protein